MRESAVVLLSGGLDSSVNLAAAIQKMEVKLALTINYGQLAFLSEVRAARSLAAYYSVPHKVIDLSWIKELGSSSLTDTRLKVPTGAEIDIENREKSQSTAKAVWVPNRNGIFLNVAASFAESMACDFVVPGFNQEEAQTFPDNSNHFINATTHALEYSTANKVKILCPTIGMEKVEIVSMGVILKLPFQMLWPCYFGGETWCLNCESCQRFVRALSGNGLDALTLGKT